MRAFHLLRACYIWDTIAAATSVLANLKMMKKLKAMASVHKIIMLFNVLEERLCVYRPWLTCLFVCLPAWTGDGMTENKENIFLFFFFILAHRIAAANASNARRHHHWPDRATAVGPHE